ncbi:hypothetical protein HGRIS_010751 [Hohenbuehelia grisea]|uniref:Uncharacterized protein n=1 Tax=Hohenbuehelia grisea TaxID=104357 RepID=A0ABR3IXR3_9AGAR
MAWLFVVWIVKQTSPGQNETVSIWDVCTGALVAEITPPTRYSWGMVTTLAWVKVAPTGETLLALGTGRGLLATALIKGFTPFRVGEVSNHPAFSLNDYIEAMASDPKASRIAIGSARGCVRVLCFTGPLTPVTTNVLVADAGPRSLRFIGNHLTIFHNFEGKIKTWNLEDDPHSPPSVRDSRMAIGHAAFSLDEENFVIQDIGRSQFKLMSANSRAALKMFATSNIKNRILQCRSS